MQSLKQESSALVLFLIALCMPALVVGQERPVEVKPELGVPGAGRSGGGMQGSAQLGASGQSRPKIPETRQAPVKKARPEYVPRDRGAMFGATRVNVAQLEEVIREAHGKRDADVARELSGLELNERLNGAQLQAWEAALPGKKSREELAAVADASVFRKPPAMEIPALAAPDLATQRHMLAQTVEYLEKSISKLPVFSATEDLTHYRYTMEDPESEGEAEPSVEPWRPTGSFKRDVRYSGGQRDTATEGAGRKAPKQEEPAPETEETFGPILSTLIVDASHGQISWGRWEQSEAGLRGVFSYEVAEANSHYEISGRAHSGNRRDVMVRKRTSYHGEIAIDPASGVISRITILADLAPDNPVDRSDMMVDYGPVQMGGVTYTLPVKSVMIASEQSEFQDEDSGLPFASEQTTLEEVKFGNYRLRGSGPDH